MPILVLEHTSRDQNLADGYQVRSVDLEDVNRRPTDGRAADQHAALIAEVVAPFVPSRMVERRDPAGGRVAAGKIRTLISIAVYMPMQDCRPPFARDACGG